MRVLTKGRKGKKNAAPTKPMQSYSSSAVMTDQSTLTDSEISPPQHQSTGITAPKKINSLSAVSQNDRKTSPSILAADVTSEVKSSTLRSNASSTYQPSILAKTGKMVLEVRREHLVPAEQTLEW